MTVRVSMDGDIYNVSFHGWANNAHRIPSCLPSNFHHAISATMPVPRCLPDGSCAPQDNIQCLCPRESMVVAATSEKNSFHPQAPQQEEEAEHVFDERSNHQIKSMDLPLPNCSFRVQSWLSCGMLAEGVNCLSPPEGPPIHVSTNLHCSVKHGQPHQGRPL